MKKQNNILKILIKAIFAAALCMLIFITACSNSQNTELSDENAIDVETADKSNENTEDLSLENESSESNVPKEEDDQKSSAKNDTNSEDQDKSLKGIYERFLNSGKPSILIFSYDADCCPGTEAFFEEYNAKAMNLVESYSGIFNAVFINIGILDKTNMNTVTELAVKYEVLNLPSILILDVSGQSHVVIDGKFNEDEVKKILDGMKND